MSLSDFCIAVISDVCRKSQGEESNIEFQVNGFTILNSLNC